MQRYQLEIRGKTQDVTLEQLRVLVSRNFVQRTATIWVNGVARSVDDVLNGAAPAAMPNPMPKPMPNPMPKPFGAAGVGATRPAMPKSAPDQVAVPVPREEVVVPNATAAGGNKRVVVLWVVAGFFIVAAVSAVSFYLGTSRTKPTDSTRAEAAPQRQEQEEDVPLTFDESDDVAGESVSTTEAQDEAAPSAVDEDESLVAEQEETPSTSTVQREENATRRATAGARNQPNRRRAAPRRPATGVSPRPNNDEAPELADASKNPRSSSPETESENTGKPDAARDDVATTGQSPESGTKSSDASNEGSDESDQLDSIVAAFESGAKKEDHFSEVEKPFDREMEVVPSSFTGNNLTALYKAILSRYSDVERQQAKNEFETSSQYRQRMKRSWREIEQTLITGEVRFGSSVAFPFFPDSVNPVRFGKISTQYVADLKKWIFVVNNVLYIQPNSKNGITWLDLPIYLDGEKDEYTGVNGLGMERRVTRWKFFEYGIQAEATFPKDFFYGSNRSVDSISFVLNNVPAEIAREKKGKIAGFCVCNLRCVSPFIDYVHIEPKFTRPTELSLTRRYIAADNLEFWFYDMSSGEIVAKFAFEEIFRKRAKNYSEAKTVFGRTAVVAKNEPSDEKSEEEQVPEKTWEETLAESVDVEERWEKKTPTVTIPDDAESLSEALAKTDKGGVILIRATGDKPIRLWSKKVARGESADVCIDHAVAIIGETGNPEDATIEIEPDETLRVELCELAAFKGIKFSLTTSSAPGARKPAVFVTDGSKAVFKNCEFDGGDAPETTGVAIEGAASSASFWKCTFQKHSSQGLSVGQSGQATVEYCQFLAGNRYGLSSLSSGKVKVDKSRFVGNVAGFQAEGGGGVVASNSYFSENTKDWVISPGSRHECDTSEGNVTEK